MAEDRFTLNYQDTDHVVTVTRRGLKRAFTWVVDGTEVATVTSLDNDLTLQPHKRHKNDNADPDSGRPELQIKCGWFSVRRVTLTVDGTAVDLVPDPRTPAARREQRIREHPTLHTLLATSAQVASIVVPLLLAGLAFTIPWPDLNVPSISFPEFNLPSIPWPNITMPSIPWPDISLPGWLDWPLENLRYIGAVAAAFVIARSEVRRQRKQDERRRAGQPASGRKKLDPKTNSEGDRDAAPHRPE